ncbi:PREDICTED: uncharacterized protein LOC109592451, partial [Amphimedon queenslandica]|uniref:Death domain-containing protein n=3 Tax=Amphimedon queenslandica TaxID=400682 RepID=A0AAN0K271_AMPQE
MEAVGGDTSILNIHDLQQVWTELKEFPLRNWREFGLTAGLYYTTLSNIEANSTKVEDHFMECLSCWLKRKDNVNKQGMPTWRRLEKILEELGEQALADRVRGLSSDAHEEQQVEPVTTSGHSIYLPEYLEDEYFRMTTEFANILKRFVIQIFKEKEKLKDVKMSLVGIRPSRRKEINEVDDETELIQVLRNYCSLRKFPILTTLARDMKMSDITKELNQFEEKRKRLYEEILAKDFAKSAIEYCGTTGSREVTFEVLWPIDRTTLDDFEQFLAAAFRSQDINMLIHLKTVHSSRLTFVCVIPHWLVEEMKDYIVKNGDLFESKGVVEITVDGAIVFSVKHSLEPHQLPS